MALYWNEVSDEGRPLYNAGVESVPWTLVETQPYAALGHVEKQASNIYGYIQKGAYGDLAEAYITTTLDLTGYTQLEITFKVWNVDMVTYAEFRYSVGTVGDHIPPVGTVEPDYQTIVVDISSLSGPQVIKIGAWETNVYLHFTEFKISSVKFLGRSNLLHRVR